MAVVKCFAFDKGCKWPKQRHFIDALFCVYNSLYFWVQKAKNGDRGTIVFTASLSVHGTISPYVVFQDIPGSYYCCTVDLFSPS